MGCRRYQQSTTPHAWTRWGVFATRRTLTVSESGEIRTVDDYQPRAQLRKEIANGTLKSDNCDNVKRFALVYATTEKLVTQELHHLELMMLICQIL